MVFDEFLKAKHEGLGALWRKPAAWRAFRDVASAGLVQFVAARCVRALFLGGGRCCVFGALPFV
jgi:hypothetical protein